MFQWKESGSWCTEPDTMYSRVPLLGKKWQLEVQKVGNIPITGVVVGRGGALRKQAQQCHSTLHNNFTVYV
jgi:hypothetical protein